MLTLLEQLDKGTLWHSPGGIHPPEMKSVSNGSEIETLPLFNQYLLPIPQVGEQAILRVKVGDRLLKGEAITQGQGIGYLPVHAPTSGTVKAIEPLPSNHASALPVMTLVLESDGKDEWCELHSAKLDELTPQDIIARVQAAGIAGMGGAAFPSHIKLSPASDIELLIVNGVECEPYITSDDRLMRERADDIIAGIEIVENLLGPKRIIIAIEDNKPEAAEAMNAALHRSHLPSEQVRVTVIPTKYPSGGEKQLIQIITGQEVPSGAIPAQLGILVHNVGTLFAVRDAVIDGKPLIERVITVTGNAVANPGNYWTLVGTQVEDLLFHCHFKASQAQKIIMGGPMMGYTVANTGIPLLKGSNCLLVPNGLEITEQPPEQPCIRCGECAVACPASLLPQQLFWHAKAEEYDKAESYNLKDCIECGCCSYVCPSDIPLVEYYRVAKAAIRQDAEEKRKAERAKVRFEARIARLEEEKAAREAKAKEAADKRKASMAGNEKDAIAAALARVQAKKAAATQEPKAEAPELVSDSSAAKDPKAGVAAAIARAKAKKAAQAESGTGADVSPESQSAKGSESVSQDTKGKAEDPKKAAVAAAIARAKAKKAAQANADAQAEEIPETLSEVNEAKSAAATTDDPKKAAVAAAIARAKAKKAAQANADAQTEEMPETHSEAAAAKSDAATTDDPKKAAVAAAIARAKAKKAAQAQTQAETQESPTEPETNLPEEESTAEQSNKAALDPKKAAVAAAIAKAKAKKAAQAEVSKANAALANDGDATANQSGNETLNEGADKSIGTVGESAATESAQPKATLQEPNANPQAMTAEEMKKARIAAAVAKAKAKKSAREQD